MMNAGWKDKAVWATGVAAALGVAYFAGKSSPPDGEAPAPNIQSIASVPASVPDQTLKVHVVGLVAKPGLYTLPLGSRVEDALEMAGGALKNADLENVNLAQRLEDGVQLRIASKSTEPLRVEGLPEGASGLSGPVFSGITSTRTSSAPVRSASSSSKSARPSAHSISINSASANELDRLPGVGPATAAKIIEYRQQHGGFSSIDELLAVRGIGPKKLADMKPYVRL